MGAATEKIHTGYVVFWILLAALLSAAPLYQLTVYGDNYVHYVLMRCYGEAFWQGNFYPRWCMDINAGVGNPALYFYFPLPFLFSSLLYPLRSLGLSVDGFFDLCTALTCVASGFTAYYWLKALFAERVALMGAILYLFLPYRIELLAMRAAYPELCCMVFLPLMLLAAHRMAEGQKHAFAGFALCTGVCLLCHVPATFAALFVLGVVTLFSGAASWRESGRNLLRISAGVMVALALTAFYWVPGVMLSKHVDLNLERSDLGMMPHRSWAWPNNFVRYWDKPKFPSFLQEEEE